ncbi:nucleotidyltransferase family protein [Nisaea sediminum]|uniref:nucleotidyltransferase family protein n=1 Tax=Nisaea sediminum TaxID=2775867 RepID=UPI0018665E6C|nr:nucleotidyltransferase family protein [Nisaea sediminum]
MTILDSILLGPDALIREALTKIDAGSSQLAIVVDAERRVLGVVTDGDVRRGLLAGVTLDDPVDRIMNRKPKLASAEAPDEEIQALMRREVIHQVPIVDENRRIVALRTVDTFVAAERLENRVVLMAGGLGTRLRPLTETVPKPMLSVGGRPLLETLVQSFIDQGFYRFDFSVNYRAEAIEEHFGNGYRFGAEISYLREEEPLGTAGSLSLMAERPAAAFFVMNGDILTSINFRHMLDFHKQTGAAATMAVFEKGFDIPYGVVEVEGDRLVTIREKPTHNFFISAGIYVLEPKVLDRIAPSRFLDMPDLFARMIEAGEAVSAFPIREYWRDIGQHQDLDRAEQDFPRVFAGK